MDFSEVNSGVDSFCVLRHDIEFSIDRAYKLAKIEANQVLKYDKRNIWALSLLLKTAKHHNEWDNCIDLAKQTLEAMKLLGYRPSNE